MPMLAAGMFSPALLGREGPKCGVRKDEEVECMLEPGHVYSVEGKFVSWFTAEELAAMRRSR
jgi:hypothetical protein